MVRLPLTAEERARGRRLGEVLRRERGERSIVEVATRAGISPETLRKIEKGRVATPAFATVAQVAAVLDLSLDDLWRRVDAVDAVAAKSPGRGRVVDRDGS